jgi:virginiamycin B lyase
MAANQIGRLTLEGEIREYALPVRGAFPSMITCGPDSALWFTMNQSNAIGRISPDGKIDVHELSRSSPFPTVTHDRTQSSPTSKEAAGSPNGQPTA